MRARTQRFVRIAAIVYLIVLIGICGVIRFDNGSHWLVTLFLFGPRWTVALPLLILVPLTLAFHFRLTFVYLLHIAVIVFSILGFQVVSFQTEASRSAAGLRLMTCNLGGGKIRTEELINLVRGQQIQILMLQECPWAISSQVFEQLGWAHRQEGGIAIGSVFGLGESRVLARHPESRYNAVAAVSCELELPTNDLEITKSPDNTAQLVSVHLPTFRPALQRAREFEFDTGAAIRTHADLYRDLVERLCRELRAMDKPMIVGGDFNVPVESTYYRDYWSNYTNAFSSVGSRLGYTKYTRYHGIRIDHVLTDSYWRIDSAIVGQDLGGDHRPVIVTLSPAR